MEHNEWLFRKATWSEIQVVNCRGGEEVWISRRYVGEVSRVDDPVLIVGLTRELELKSGMIVPVPAAHHRDARGCECSHPPRGSGGGAQNEPAPVVGIRLEPSDRRIFRMILIAVGTLLVLYLVALSFTRVGELRQRNVVFVGNDKSYLGLNGHDDYLSVTQKLGAPPTTDHSQETGTILYRALGYPDRRYTVILMGAEKGSMTYIGTMDQDWRPIQSVNAHTDALLRGLRKFLEVFQKPNPFPKSIFDNIAYGLRINGMGGKGTMAEAVEKSLRRAALWEEVKDQLHKSAYALSGGQQQRLCIARALAVEPEVLLLDEPCSALDPIATAKIEELLFNLKDICTMVIVTHNMQQAARTADFTGFFLMGRLIEFNKTAMIFKTPARKETEDYITGRFG